MQTPDVDIENIEAELVDPNGANSVKTTQMQATTPQHLASQIREFNAREIWRVNRLRAD